MEAALLFFREGVRSLGKKKLADGNEYEMFFKARSPAEVSGFRGAISAFTQDEDGSKRRDAYMARFLASALCREDGSPFLTPDQAAKIPDTFKTELCLDVLSKSSALDAGNG